MKTLQNKTVKLLCKLKKQNKISNKIYKRIKPRGSQLPHLYLSPKLHKFTVQELNNWQNLNCSDRLKWRPIISTVKSPTYKIAKWLINVSRPLWSNAKYNKAKIKSLKNFTNSMDSRKLGKDDIIISIDADTLFTNIPLQKAFDIVYKRATTDTSWQQLSDIDADTFITLLKICLERKPFQWNNKCYEQIYGTSMGDPLSMFISGVMMEHIDDQIQNAVVQKTLPPNKLWYREVDDILTQINKQDINKYIKYINGLHEGMSFSYELPQTNWKVDPLTKC